MMFMVAEYVPAATYGGVANDRLALQLKPPPPPPAAAEHSVAAVDVDRLATGPAVTSAGVEVLATPLALVVLIWPLGPMQPPLPEPPGAPGQNVPMSVLPGVVRLTDGVQVRKLAGISLSMALPVGLAFVKFESMVAVTVQPTRVPRSSLT